MTDRIELEQIREGKKKRLKTRVRYGLGTVAGLCPDLGILPVGLFNDLNHKDMKETLFFSNSCTCNKPTGSFCFFVIF